MNRQIVRHVNPIGVAERASTETYPLEPEWMSDALVFIHRHVSDGISAEDVFIDSEDVIVDVGTLAEKKVPLIPNYTLKTAPQYFEYSAPVVSQDSIVIYGEESIIEDISLVQFDYDEVLGITRCVYSKEVTSFAAFAHYRAHPAGYSEDILILERQFDTLGRLLREAYRGGAEALGDYEKLYGYDDLGRILYEIRKDDLGRDSLGYRYNSLGNLIEKSGKSWNLEQESDVTIIYRPDGSPMEKTTIFYEEDWDYGANPENRIIERIYYDKHGNITRKEAENVREYDNEYW